MHKKSLSFMSILILSFFIGGCVTTATYDKKSAEADSKAKELASVMKERDELDKVLKSKTDDLSKSIAELRQKTADLEAENTKLKDNVAELKKKEAEVQSESNTYKQLTQEMKGEIAKGQITISELKGKLTLDVVDKILFASGQAEVTKEGLAVLKRVIDLSLIHI